MKRIEKPLEMLQTCHARIERQLATLEKLAEQVAASGCDDLAQSRAKDVLDYFDTSAAQHHRDEDEDLFPLLRRRAGALGRSEIAALIGEMEREHSTMDAQWQRLREQLKAIARSRDSRLDAEEVARFAWLYRRHMDRETAAVLPFAREALSGEQQAAFAERMALRRRLSR
jgi:hemerythrin-like domain-containing protein